jgi:hypothetical protein
MSGSRSGPSTYTFRISSEGMQEFVQELSRLSSGSEQANAAIGRLVQSSPQLASALTTAQEATARAAQRATELQAAQQRGAAVAEASVVPMRRASDALGNLESRTLAARRATADLRGALELLGAGGLSAALGPVAGAVGNVADVFGIASLATQGFGGALSAAVPLLAPLAAGITLVGGAAIALSSAYEATAENARRVREGEEAYQAALAQSNALLRDNTALIENSFEARRQEAIGAVQLARAIEQETLARANEAASRAAGVQQRLEDAVANGRAAPGQVQGGLDRARATAVGLAGVAQVISDRLAELDVRLTQLNSLRYERPAGPPVPAGLGREPAARGGGGAAPREIDLEADFLRAEALAQRVARANIDGAERVQNEILRVERRGLEQRERENERAADNIARYLGDSLTDAFATGERDFAGMLRTFQQTALSTPIRIGIEALVRPVAQAGVSAVSGAGGGIMEALGLASAGRQAAGLLGLGGGEGGLLAGVTGALNAPLFGQAALASSTNSALGALPGGMFGPAAPSSLGLGGVTFGQALGGIGGGFALGSAIGSFTAGDSRARQTNSQIGAGAGAAAGAVIGSIVPGVGTVIGGLIGGALGGGGGGLIGPGRAFSGGDALVGVNDNGALTVQGFAGKNFADSAQLLAQAQQQVSALNSALSALGLRFTAGASPEGGFAAAIGGGESGNPRNLIEALTGAGVTTLRAEDSRVQAALDRLFAAGGGSIETQIGAANEAASFAAQIDAMAQAAKDAADPIGAIKRSFEEQFRLAERLGFGYETLAEAQQKAIDAAEAQKRAEEERAAAARIGAARGILDDLTIGGIGGLDPAAQATAARLRLAEARSAGADGFTTSELEDLRRVAGQTLPLIQRVEGITAEFAALVRGVTADALAAVPGADGAGLAGVIDATTSIGDQISNTVSFAGGATVAAIRSLEDQIGRLALRLEAQDARRAA